MSNITDFAKGLFNVKGNYLNSTARVIGDTARTKGIPGMLLGGAAYLIGDKYSDDQNIIDEFEASWLKKLGHKGKPLRSDYTGATADEEYSKDIRSYRKNDPSNIRW
tara:strand:- start:294 stop:614 length:321 start_codon:yes stop_codon:yes gene_type:complete